MSEIQSVLDEIKKSRKHAKDGICFFILRLNVYFFFLQVLIFIEYLVIVTSP